jgi:riboflavin synthase
VASVSPDGGSLRIDVLAPESLGQYIAPKGSIALDGVSLTVNDVRQAEDGATHFSVNIVPHTAANTTLGKVEAGRQFNVEIDVIARYLERLLAARAHATS